MLTEFVLGSILLLKQDTKLRERVVNLKKQGSQFPQLSLSNSNMSSVLHGERETIKGINMKNIEFDIINALKRQYPLSQLFPPPSSG